MLCFLCGGLRCCGVFIWEFRGGLLGVGWVECLLGLVFGFGFTFGGLLFGLLFVLGWVWISVITDFGMLVIWESLGLDLELRVIVVICCFAFELVFVCFGCFVRCGCVLFDSLVFGLGWVLDFD